MLWKERQSESSTQKKSNFYQLKIMTNILIIIVVVVVVSSAIISLGPPEDRSLDPKTSEWRMSGPWAVGTNGKFTESATFHNSARRQLSTNLAEGLRNSSSNRNTNQTRLGVPSRRRKRRGNSHGPPSVTIFTLSDTFPAPRKSHTQRKQRKTKRHGQSKDKRSAG